jgi:pyridoxal 5'-phosphate synthase glutaminase subunit Pdx2
VKIGVLALQGAFREHLDTLAAIGVEGVRVREPADLEGLSGLILPGGESTTMRQLIDRWGLRGPILDLARSGAPILGTCAGMIVLAREIAGGEEPILPLLDVRVERKCVRVVSSSRSRQSCPSRSWARRLSMPSSSGRRSSRRPVSTSTCLPAR